MGIGLDRIGVLVANSLGSRGSRGGGSASPLGSTTNARGRRDSRIQTHAEVLAVSPETSGCGANSVTLTMVAVPRRWDLRAVGVSGGKMDTVVRGAWMSAWGRASYTFRFVSLLAVCALVAATAAPLEDVLRGFTEGAVVTVVPWLGLVASSQHEGVVLFQRQSAVYTYQIVRECAALNVLLMFSAAVLAYHLDLRRRLVSVAIGVVILVVANVLRLVSLAMVGVYRPSWFSPMHDVGWPFFQIGGVVLMTLWWARWAASPKVGASNATRLPLLDRRTLGLSAVLTIVLLSGLVVGAHELYARALMTLLGPVARVLWGTRVSFTVHDLDQYALTRFAVLVIAIALVVVTGVPGRTAKRAGRVAGLVVAVQILGSIVAATLAVAAAPPQGGVGAPSGGAAIFFAVVESGLIALVVLRATNRRRPALRST